jgi:frataxin
MTSLSETAYHALADLTLHKLADQAERLDEGIDAELYGGVLTLTLDSGRQFVVNKHAPTQQVWLSSPLSGGLHFAYQSEAQAFALPDGRRLETLLMAELETLLEQEGE